MSTIEVEERKLQDLKTTLNYLLQQQGSHADQQEAYELQLQEAVRASLGDSRLLKASCNNFLADDALHIPEALLAQVSIYRAAIELQADRLLACRLECQVEHCVPAEDRAERYLHDSVTSRADTPRGDNSRQQDAVIVCMKLVCGAAAFELQGVEIFHWLATLLSPSGTAEWAAYGTWDIEHKEQAQLHSLLHGARMAMDLNVSHLTVCLDADLLDQVAEHSKQETPEDLKALLKDIDDTLAQFDTVCGESLSDEDLDLLETVTAGRYNRTHDCSLEDDSACCSGEEEDLQDEEESEEEEEEDSMEQSTSYNPVGSDCIDSGPLNASSTDRPGPSRADPAESSITLPDLTSSMRAAGLAVASKLFPDCGICMEEAFGTCQPHKGCHGSFCRNCRRQHIMTQVASKIWPITCPAPDCHAKLSMDDCLGLVFDEKPLRKLAEEAAIPESLKLYCPVPACSQLLRLPISLASVVTAGECSACHVALCLTCRSLGHKGMTCAEAQAGRKTNDADLLALAKEKGWKQCKQCRQMIELEAGCNHIVCKCGGQFCYSCGTSYQAGRQQCRCDLFDARAALGPDADLRQCIEYRRRTFPRYKTQLCWSWKEDDPTACRNGDNCNFAHGHEELL